MKKKYVLGFVFNPEGSHVLLIQKRTPSWMHNCWNGIGGKIEPNEKPLDAMHREAIEEAGLSLAWIPVGFLHGDEFEISVFSTNTPRLLDATTRTSEPVAIHPIDGLSLLPTIRNVPALVSLCRPNSGVRSFVLFDEPT